MLHKLDSINTFSALLLFLFVCLLFFFWGGGVCFVLFGFFFFFFFFFFGGGGGVICVTHLKRLQTFIIDIDSFLFSLSRSVYLSFNILPSPFLAVLFTFLFKSAHHDHVNPNSYQLTFPSPPPPPPPFFFSSFLCKTLHSLHCVFLFTSLSP